MIIPGIMGIVMGCLLINRLRDTPETMGLPSVEEYKNDRLSSNHQTTQLSTKDIIFKYVVGNYYLWILALAYVMVYVIRTAVNDWGAVFLHEHGFSIANADSCLSFFEIGGFLGSLAAGWMSDTWFKGRRGETNALFSLGTIGAIALMWWAPSLSYMIYAGLFFCVGFFIFGPQMLIGVAAVEASHRQAAGTATGFIGLWGYVGAALSGFPIGYIITHWGWAGFYSTLFVCAIISLLLLSSLTYPSLNEKKMMRTTSYPTA